MAIVERVFQQRELQDPPWFRRVFSDTRLAPLWLVARVYLGYQWLLAGWHKMWGEGRWINVPGEDGASLKSFWERVTAIPEEGSPPIKYDWYRDFLKYMLDNDWYTWFSWFIAFGEVLAGVALIVGAFTGIAALAGATMNFNFMLAGSASTNPVLFILAILVLFGWKVAGWMGVDRWLLPALGTPWQSGAVTKSIAERASHGPGGRPARSTPT